MKRDKNAAGANKAGSQLKTNIVSPYLRHGELQLTSHLGLAKHPVQDLFPNFPVYRQGARVRRHPQCNEALLTFLKYVRLTQHAENKHSKTIADCFPTFGK